MKAKWQIYSTTNKKIPECFGQKKIANTFGPKNKKHAGET
jgi:hypothetical protein